MDEGVCRAPDGHTVKGVVPTNRPRICVNSDTSCDSSRDILFSESEEIGFHNYGGVRLALAITMVYNVCQRIMYYATVQEVGTLLCASGTRAFRCSKLSEDNTTLWSQDVYDAGQIFYGVSYLLSFSGGLIGDAVLGHYVCLVVGGVLNSASMVMLLVYSQTTTASLVWLGLVLLALGTGVCQANVSVFGAWQLRQPYTTAHLTVFYMAFYWCMALGETVGLGLTLIAPGVYYTIFIPSLCCGVLSLALLIFGRSIFETNKPDASFVLKLLNSVHGRSAQSERLSARVISTLRRQIMITVPLFAIMVFHMVSQFQSKYTFVMQTSTYLMVYANVNGAGRYLGVMASGLIIMLALPCMACLSMKGALRCPFRRIRGGMLFMIGSLVTAGLTSLYQDKLMPPVGVRSKTMWVTMIFLPQYILSGVSECLTLAAGYEIFWTYCDKRLKGAMSGFFVMSWGASSLLVFLLSWMFSTIARLDTWMSSSTNDDLHYWYFLLAGIEVFVFAFYFAYMHYVDRIARSGETRELVVQGNNS